MFGSSFKTNKDYQVWMSHSDAVKQLPEGFESIASSDNCKSAAVQNIKKNLRSTVSSRGCSYIQGKEILMNFVIKVCKCKKSGT